MDGPISDWPPTAGGGDDGPQAEPGPLGGGTAGAGSGGIVGGAPDPEEDAGAHAIADAGSSGAYEPDAGCDPDAGQAEVVDAADAAPVDGAPADVDAAVQVFENDADAAEPPSGDAELSPFAAPHPACP